MSEIETKSLENSSSILLLSIRLTEPSHLQAHSSPMPDVGFSAWTYPASPSVPLREELQDGLWRWLLAWLGTRSIQLKSTSGPAKWPFVLHRSFCPCDKTIHLETTSTKEGGTKEKRMSAGWTKFQSDQAAQSSCRNGGKNRFRSREINRNPFFSKEKNCELSFWRICSQPACDLIELWKVKGISKLSFSKIVEIVLTKCRLF